MPWQQSELCTQLGLKYPLVQGPFGGGLSSVRLAATVSNNGGLGSFGAHHLSGADIYQTIRELRASTNQPFNINLWVSDHDEGGLSSTAAEFDQNLQRFQSLYASYGVNAPAKPESFTYRFDDQIQAVLDARPAVLSVVYGIPSSDIIEQCHRNGVYLIGTATTVQEAIALENAGVDAIVATGFEAGGHRVSFLASAEESLMGTMSLIPQVVDRVRVPIIAAGGIADARGIVAATVLGASGVQMGTAFLACQESNTIEAHRRLLLSRESHQTVLSRHMTGRLARFIPNTVLKTLQKNSPLPFPQQSWFVGPIKRAAAERNDASHFSLYASQSSSLLKHKSAPELMQEFFQGVERVQHQLL